MTSRDLDKYTKEIIQKFISTREVTLTNDTVMSYPGFLETLIMQVYRDGLKEGRDCLLKWKQLACFVEWHDLQKNPNDLPKGHKVVLNQVGARTTYEPKRGFLGFEGAGIRAWCDIPLFKGGNYDR